MTAHEEGRLPLAGPDGRAVLTYVRGTHHGRPCAKLVEVIGPNPVPSVLASMSGWIVEGPEDLGRQLVRHGGYVVRHAHTMRRDLVSLPLPAEWSVLSLPGELRSVPCIRPARDVLPAWRCAFPAGHPDHFQGSDEEALETQLGPLLAGEMVGPVLGCSALAVDGADRVVAGAVITDRGGLPWIANVFRRPDVRFPGLGSVLLRRVLVDAASRGFPSMGLAVSEGNPARRLYEKLGFRLSGTSLSVLVP